MLRYLKYTLFLVLGLTLLLTGYLAWFRLGPPTPAQAEALQALRNPPPAPGENAWGLLWLAAYDIPDGEWSAVLAEDIAAIDALADIDPMVGGGEPYRSVAEARYAKAPSIGPHLLSCREQGNCLARLRQQADAAREDLQAQQAMLTRLAGLSQAGHVRPLFRPSMGAPLAYHPSGMHQLIHTELGLRHLDGDPAALADTCALHATWRRFVSHSTLLIDRMVFQAYSRESAQLLAAMLSELPAGEPLPPSCEAAWALPGEAELQLCPALSGEFALNETVMHAISTAESRSLAGRLGLFLLHSPDLAARWSAEGIGWTCTAEGRARLASDLPGRPEVAPKGRWPDLACGASYVSCVLVRIGAPAYTDYAHRVMDYGAEQRLLAAVVWLRGPLSRGVPLDTALADLPEDLTGPARRPHLAEDGLSLQVVRYGKGAHGEPFRLPLPPFAALAEPDAPAVEPEPVTSAQ